MSDQTTQRAAALQETGRHTEAARLLSEALAGDPDNRDYLAALAVSLEGLDRHADLLGVSRRLIELDPDNAVGYLFAASAHHSLEQNEQAVAAADRAVRLSPHNPGSHRMYAWTSSSLVWQQSSGAWAHIVTHDRGVLPLQAAQRAVELGPDDADNHACLGTIAMRHGRRRLARDAFNHALRIEPGHGLAHHNLGVLDRAGLRLGSAANHLVTSASVPGATGRSATVQSLVAWWAGVIAALSWWIWHVLTLDTVSPALNDGLAGVGLLVLAAWILAPLLRADGHTRRALRRMVGASRLLTAWATAQIIGWLLAAVTLLPLAASVRPTLSPVVTGLFVTAFLLTLAYSVSRRVGRSRR